MPKVFSCSGCGGQHKRPVGAKCQVKDTENVLVGRGVTEGSGVVEGVNQNIINTLTSVSSRLSPIEVRIDKTEQHIQSVLCHITPILLLSVLPTLR